MSSFDQDYNFNNFRMEAFYNRRYIRSEKANHFLEAVANSCKKRIRNIPDKCIFWRAQLGNGWRYEAQIEDEVPAPFSAERMKPLRNQAYEGRANPKGIPYLYVATTRETALSEVRPSLENMISVGQFKTNKAMKIIDCSEYHAKGFPLSFRLKTTEEERELEAWTYIDRSFSQPVTKSDNTSDYISTQIIAELFNSLGYDGIAYKSSFGEDGYNIAFFDLDCADLINCSLYKASNIEYRFKEECEPYFLKK